MTARQPTSDEPRQRSSLLGNVGALLGAQGLTWVMTTIVTVIVPRVVGPEAIGQFRVANSLWAIAGVAIGLGTGAVVTLEIARNQAVSPAPLGPVFLARLLGFVVVLFPLAAFVVVVRYDRGVVILLVIGGFTALLSTMGEVGRAALSGLERLRPVARADVLSKTFYVVVTVLVAVLTRNIYLVAVVAVLTAAALTADLLRSLGRLVAIRYRSSLGEAREVIRRGRPFLLIGLTIIVYLQIDVIVMSILVSDVEIGWYGTADVLFGSLLFVTTILMSSFLPVMARKHEEDPASALAAMSQAFRSLMLIGIPVGLGLLVVSTPLAVLLYGPAFRETGPVLAVFGIVLIFTYQTVLLGGYATATGRQRFWNVVMLIAIAATIVLDLVLVPWTSRVFDNGAIGGAVAYVGTESMMVVLGIWKLAPGLASRQTLARLTKCGVAGAAMVAVCWPLRERFIALPVAAGVVVYAGIVLLLRPFEPHELVVLDGFRARLPIGRRPAAGQDGSA